MSDRSSPLNTLGRLAELKAKREIAKATAAVGGYNVMNLYSVVRSLVVEKVDALKADGTIPDNVDTDTITVERPKDSTYGELATNAAIVLAGQSGRRPHELADELAQRLADDTLIADASVAGPGFINLELKPNAWMGVVQNCLCLGGDFGRSRLGAGQNVNLEFVSANPTGPLHLGHARGAVFGDSLGRLLEYSGFKVWREFYINDGGAQVDALARSAYQRYLEANGEQVVFEDGAYKGDYLIEVGIVLKEKFGTAFIGQPEQVWMDPVRAFAVDRMMHLIREDLKMIDVRMDGYFSEKSLYESGRIEESVRALEAKGLICSGVLDPPKGKKSKDWEPREQMLFKSTLHGDDVDRPIKKSDGTWTYFAPDIAYHYDKIVRNFDVLINIFGADHSGYCNRLKAAVSALSDNQVQFEIKLIQLVKVISKDGPLKMSKREGRFVELREAVLAVGPDVTRFVMLMRRNDAPLDFNFEEVREQSRENPVFYVQYAHARICSLIARAVEAGMAATDADLALADMSLLTHPAEITFARKIAEWPRMVETAAKHHEPHRIAFYLNELASEFHTHWAKGNSTPSLRILQDGDDSRNTARLALARSAGMVIAIGLDILGVTPMEEMRG